MADTPSDTVFFGDLPATFDDAQLTAIFGPYGTIKDQKLLAPGSLGKRGAIVKFATVDEARWIVENLNGNIPQGLTEIITCNFKRQSKGGDKGGWGKGGGDYGYGGGGGWNDWGPYDGKGSAEDGTSKNVFFADLPATLDGTQLETIFGAYGKIESSKLLEPGSSGKRAAIISFVNLHEAKWIVENLNGNIPQGLSEIIRVSYKLSNKGGGKGGDYGKGYDAKGYGKGYDEGKGYDSKGKGKGIQALLDEIFESGVMPGGTTYNNEQNSLFVGGLPRDCTDKELYQMFSVFGALAPRGVRAMPGDDGYSICRGYGFVNFLEPGAAEKAMNTLNGTALPDGSTLKVMVKQQNKGKGKGGKGDGW